MKSHFSLLVRFFLVWLLTFLVGKLAFFVHNGWPGFADALQIYWHGLPLDIAVAAYLTAPLWLVLTCAITVEGETPAALATSLIVTGIKISYLW